MLRVHDLVAGYGAVKVLRGVTLAVGDGEIVTLLGPNGAGKTTLFRSIAGQIRPRRGRIMFGERDLVGRPMWEIARLGIGYVPEGRQLFTSLSVRENLELAALHGGRLDQATAGRQRETVFALFPVLAQRQGYLAAALSGGQQQMLAVARALMARPRFLVLDEPSLGLAPRVVRDIFRAIAEIHRQGVGVLLIEQNPSALAISDRLYVLDRGRITLAAPAGVAAPGEAIERLYLGFGRASPVPAVGS